MHSSQGLGNMGLWNHWILDASTREQHGACAGEHRIIGTQVSHTQMQKLRLIDWIRRVFIRLSIPNRGRTEKKQADRQESNLRGKMMNRHRSRAAEQRRDWSRAENRQGLILVKESELQL